MKPRVALRLFERLRDKPEWCKDIENYYVEELSKYKARSERAKQSRNKSSKEQQ